MLFCVWGSRDFALPHQDYTSTSLVILFVICQSPVGFGISVSVLSFFDAFAGDLPFEILLVMNYCLTQKYNLINCHLSNARARLFPYRYIIVHLSPSLFLHPKQEILTLSFLFCEFLPRTEELYESSSIHGRGDSD